MPEFVPHHFVAFSAKCTTFYETEVLSPRSERFVIFALSALHFSDFQQSARVCTKQRFQPMISMFCHSPTWAPLLVTFSKVHEFVQNTVFSPGSVSFAIFPPGHHFLATFKKVHAFVQNSVFSSGSARFFIFALGVQLFSAFQQSARVRKKPRFQPEIRTFCHFRTGHTTL